MSETLKNLHKIPDPQLRDFAQSLTSADPGDKSPGRAYAKAWGIDYEEQKKICDERGAMLSRRGEVARVINAHTSEVANDYKAQQDRLVERLVDLASATVGDILEVFTDEKGNKSAQMRNIKDIPKGALAAVESITTNKSGGVSVKMVNKVQTNTLLANILGMRTQSAKVEINAQQNNYSGEVIDAIQAAKRLGNEGDDKAGF